MSRVKKNQTDIKLVSALVYTDESKDTPKVIKY